MTTVSVVWHCRYHLVVKETAHVGDMWHGNSEYSVTLSVRHDGHDGGAV